MLAPLVVCMGLLCGSRGLALFGDVDAARLASSSWSHTAPDGRAGGPSPVGSRDSRSDGRAVGSRDLVTDIAS